MIASLPILLMKVKFTAPDSMNETVLAGSPCPKTVPGFSSGVTFSQSPAPRLRWSDGPPFSLRF